MPEVTELGYVVLGVSDLARWKTFAASSLGLEVVDGDTDRQAFLRMDYWRHRLILEEDGADDLTVLGFRVAGQEEFRQMARHLTDNGTPVTIASRQEADARHVLELMTLKDPSCFPIEIFHGPQVQADQPFHPGRRMHGKFKTGAGGMGHLMQRETVGFEKTYDFYKLLGMRGGIEYRIMMPGMTAPAELMFMHCNERDHTVAFGSPGAKRVNHLMLEVDCFDDVGLAYDTVRAAGIPVVVTPGRHANDQMYSFYFMTPSGWMCEIGWGARPSTHQSEYYQRDTFGHEPVAGAAAGLL